MKRFIIFVFVALITGYFCYCKNCCKSCCCSCCCENTDSGDGLKKKDKNSRDVEDHKKKGDKKKNESGKDDLEKDDEKKDGVGNVEEIRKIFEECENLKNTDYDLPVTVVRRENSDCALQFWCQIMIREVRFLEFFRRLREAGIIKKDTHPVCYAVCEFVNEVLKKENRKDMKKRVSCYGILKALFSYKDGRRPKKLPREVYKYFYEAQVEEDRLCERNIEDFQCENIGGIILDTVLYELFWGGDERYKENTFKEFVKKFFGDDTIFPFYTYGTDISLRTSLEDIFEIYCEKESGKRDWIVSALDEGKYLSEVSEKAKQYIEGFAKELYEGKAYNWKCKEEGNYGSVVFYELTVKAISIYVEDFHFYSLLRIGDHWYNYDDLRNGDNGAKEMEEEDFVYFINSVFSGGKEVGRCYPIDHCLVFYE